MKTYFVIALFILAGCGSEPEDTKIETTVEKEIEPVSDEPTTVSSTGIKAGEYFEYYSSGGIKIKGFHNSKLLREGLWISYYEDGTKWSESYYRDGKREGHSLTFFPNGEIRYVGEYTNDKKTGVWSFYDETGKLLKEEKY